jgi:acetolactate synthase-1/2/3 large subunit
VADTLHAASELCRAIQPAVRTGDYHLWLMAPLTAGRAVVAALERAGVRHAFTVPGESFLELLDALRDSSIRLVATRHEAGAGFMAEAYAQLEGIPAVCLVTRAVGTANLSIALHTALADSAPLVAIAGQAPRAFRGREALQEVDLVATFGALCKGAAELDEPATIARDVETLVRAATIGRPGPVLLSLPEDALIEEVEPSPPGSFIPMRAAELEASPDDAEVRAVLQRLAEARRPVVIAGAGVLRSGAVEELAAFADAADVPVMASWRRPDVFANESPRYLGATGLGAARTVLPRLLEADVILAIGTRLSQVATFDYVVPGPGTDVLHVDVAPGLRGDRLAPALSIRSDAGAFLRRALEMLPSSRASAKRAGDLARDRSEYLDASALPDTGPRGPDELVHPGTVIGVLRRRLAPGTVVTTDAGNFAGWAARYLPLPRGSRFLGPTSGAMGYGLPAAVGAAIAGRDLGHPGGPVVALAGDGGFAMLMAELETAVREGLRIAVIVFDNGMYGTIRMHQERAYPGRVAATDLGRIDFAAFAEACGARGLRAAHDREVDAAIAVALDSPGVTLVHVLTDPREISVDITRPD